ncbi:MAG: hypothetical protein IJC17_05275 [Clostridia bacterium]|nr:hypothetical protein [Clostridia bacterium]
MLKQWLEQLKGEKGQRLIVILGFVGMGLILLSHFWSQETESTSVSADVSYAAELESRLTALVAGVEGVGECTVMITLESGTEYVYTTPTVLVTEVLPKVRGVVVVCDGGDNAAVCERVTEVITTALNIPERRVCVTKSI